MNETEIIAWLEKIDKHQREQAVTLAALTAKLDAMAARSRSEIDVLFGEQRAIGQRLSHVEVTYLPREQHASEHAKLDQHLAELRGELKTLRVSVAAWSGAAAAVATIASWLIRGLWA